jgi:hypothetical protein
VPEYDAGQGLPLIALGHHPCKAYEGREHIDWRPRIATPLEDGMLTAAGSTAVIALIWSLLRTHLIQDAWIYRRALAGMSSQVQRRANTAVVCMFAPERCILETFP